MASAWLKGCSTSTAGGARGCSLSLAVRIVRAVLDHMLCALADEAGTRSSLPLVLLLLLLATLPTDCIDSGSLGCWLLPILELDDLCCMPKCMRDGVDVGLPMHQLESGHMRGKLLLERGEDDSCQGACLEGLIVGLQHLDDLLLHVDVVLQEHPQHHLPLQQLYHPDAALMRITVKELLPQDPNQGEGGLVHLELLLLARGKTSEQ